MINQNKMTLYTEEQVRFMLGVSENINMYENILTFEDILKTQTPIELPSDEEIEEMSLEEVDGDFSPAEEFQRGAKWMRSKLLTFKSE